MATQRWRKEAELSPVCTGQSREPDPGMSEKTGRGLPRLALNGSESDFRLLHKGTFTDLWYDTRALTSLCCFEDYKNVFKILAKQHKVKIQNCLALGCLDLDSKVARNPIDSPLSCKQIRVGTGC